MASKASAALQDIEQSTGQSYVVARKDEPHHIKGRRDFFDYIDLGVTDGSNRAMRAQITRAKQGMTQPTGWHVHLCEGQFVYMLKGWVELQFADGETIRVGEGDSVYIPGHTPHNEIRTSDDFELIEFSVPADMGTEPCDPPA